jgi:hypothetical protein
MIFWQRRLLVITCIVEEISSLFRRFPQEVMLEGGIRRAGD